ncbi:MAG: methyltransferase domain-containing protein [Anaerolineales bacterium]|nr:methyltransferase domain-containing protein [Anaerolineales bacterium]
MPYNPDLDRLRTEYAARDARLADSDRYSPFNRANLFLQQGRQRLMLDLLQRRGFAPLAGQRILEVGCGAGGVLSEFLWAGATPTLLHGVELLPERLHKARQQSPHLPLTCADGQRLPYPDQTFDLVMQFTVFSSILDDGIKANLAAEMRRVLQPRGLILWYDFWLNPTNPQTRGIRPAEVRRLFPGCRAEFHRLTLAPPLARRIVPFSWILAALFEKLVVFNTHYLAVLQPGQDACGTLEQIIRLMLY